MGELAEHGAVVPLLHGRPQALPGTRCACGVLAGLHRGSGGHPLSSRDFLAVPQHLLPPGNRLEGGLRRGLFRRHHRSTTGRQCREAVGQPGSPFHLHDDMLRLLPVGMQPQRLLQVALRVVEQPLGVPRDAAAVVCLRGPAVHPQGARRVRLRILPGLQLEARQGGVLAQRVVLGAQRHAGLVQSLEAGLVARERLRGVASPDEVAPLLLQRPGLGRGRGAQGQRLRIGRGLLPESPSGPVLLLLRGRLRIVEFEKLLL
mmetsp:Transcript_11909/g.35953  ORF Transcript_11909/g.35953 Transcript_11909/m.35953 type:complete len:260 (-) Transcript_11909:53-832(-)